MNFLYSMQTYNASSTIQQFWTSFSKHETLVTIDDMSNLNLK